MNVTGEAVISGETAVIPSASMVLGHNFDPAIHIGPAMTRKALQRNGQTVYCSTVRSLTPDELADESIKKKKCEDFTDTKVNSVLGDGFKYKDFANPELVDLEIPTSQTTSTMMTARCLESLTPMMSLLLTRTISILGPR
ncbi:hypothetical protein MHU86_5021 [Fragilaria crotonensis]|nr:hypothetical protein MHU86_5021 [Fragilaria crotonensis]